ncbi:MAG: hypothetical protein KAT00_09510 [Planctomycetes bacterium]|nr:hypothetical protein [Planctomycetota bacterium]
MNRRDFLKQSLGASAAIAGVWGLLVLLVSILATGLVGAAEAKEAATEGGRAWAEANPELKVGYEPQNIPGRLDILPTDGRNIYRLEAADLKGDPENECIVGSTYEGLVCAFTGAGKHLWDAPTGGFCFDLAAGDLDGDGKEEAFAACSDGYLYAFSSEGNLLWKALLDGTPLQSVVVVPQGKETPLIVAGTSSGFLAAFSANGKIINDTVLEHALPGGAKGGRLLRSCVRALATGDFDGDGVHEVCVGAFPSRQDCYVYFLSVPDFKIAFWEKPYYAKDIGRATHGINMVAADIDGDGIVEAVSQSGVYAPEKPDGPVMEWSIVFPRLGYASAYRMRIPAVGRLKSGSDKPYLVTTYGMDT